MAKHTITNTAGGPRVINGADGPVTIAAGASQEVDVSEAELKIAKGTEWFEFGAAAAKASAKDADETK